MVCKLERPNQHLQRAVGAQEQTVTEVSLPVRIVAHTVVPLVLKIVGVVAGVANCAIVVFSHAAFSNSTEPDFHTATRVPTGTLLSALKSLLLIERSDRSSHTMKCCPAASASRFNRADSFRICRTARERFGGPISNEPRG